MNLLPIVYHVEIRETFKTIPDTTNTVETADTENIADMADKHPQDSYAINS